MFTIYGERLNCSFYIVSISRNATDVGINKQNLIENTMQKYRNQHPTVKLHKSFIYLFYLHVSTMNNYTEQII